MAVIAVSKKIKSILLVCFFAVCGITLYTQRRMLTLEVIRRRLDEIKEDFFLRNFKAMLQENESTTELYHNGDISSIATSASASTTTATTRVAILTYIGITDEEVQTFLTMLHGSWRYITDNKNELASTNKQEVINSIDILAFCIPKICQKLQPHCIIVNDIASTIKNQDINKMAENVVVPTCWAVQHFKGVETPYPGLYSYVMFNRTDISSLIPKYDYLMRTDYDVFLTPSFLWYKPNKTLLFGKGGYSMQFNMDRIPIISKRLGYKHRKVYNIGSTWYGESKIFIEAGKQMFAVTEYLFLNEFKPYLDGLERFDLEHKPDGMWPDWYRPVASMYAGEIIINHFVEDISEDNEAAFDGASCSAESIRTSLHIHCWHTQCEFNKFNFMKDLELILFSIQHNLLSDDSKMLQQLKENFRKRDTSEMSLQEYSTFIAWHSAGHYLDKWLAKNS